MPDTERFLYGLSRADSWVHYICPPDELWRAYCDAPIDWEFRNLDEGDTLCPYCIVLKEMEDATSKQEFTA